MGNEEIESAIAEFIPLLKKGTDPKLFLPPACSKLPHLDSQEILSVLISHHIPIQREIKSVSKKAKINSSRYRDAMGRRQYQNTMNTLTDIVSIVNNNPEGITKTSILKELRKDASYWRPKVALWLLDLCEDGVIKSDHRKVATRYYPETAYVKNREREIHRRIGEALMVHGDLTMTQLAIKVGRNGGKNRSQVVEALSDLEREGFVRMGERSRWRWSA